MEWTGGRCSQRFSSASAWCCLRPSTTSGRSTISLTERELVFSFEHYDSTIRATVDGDRLTGTWVHTMAEGPESMPFAAQRGATPRFFGKVEAPSHPVPSSIDGRWSAVFTNPGGSTFPALGIFLSAGDRLEGTFLTETGDYRYLDGRYEQGRLELSCFDGAHSFLLRADVDASGSLVGDSWAMGGYHSTRTATAMAADARSPLTDPASVVALSPAAKDGRFEFSFPDLDGNSVSHDAPRFAGKVVLVDIFGTWCPNGNGYAPLLARWHERYGPRGLELVGLAFEMTGDPKRDRTFVRRYAERYGIEFRDSVASQYPVAPPVASEIGQGTPASANGRPPGGIVVRTPVLGGLHHSYGRLPDGPDEPTTLYPLELAC